MTKRVLAGILWFFAVAYAWNVVAMVMGFTDAPGYVLGAVAGFLFAVDPAHRVWHRPAMAGNPATASSAA
jgi:hypothetical protein